MFSVHHRAVADTEPFEYFDCSSPAVGKAMTLSSGKLTACASTTKPDYICMSAAGRDQDGKVAAIRVLPTTVFEVTANASQSSLYPGSLVTIASNALQVTATTTSGVFTLDTVATASGGICTGHFA